MSLDQLVPALAEARALHQAALDKEKAIREELLSDPKYLAAKEVLEHQESELAQADEAVRSAALEAYAADSSTKKVHPKVSITIRRNVIIGDAKKVWMWVKSNLPTAVKIDETKLKQHARAVEATQPIPEHVARIEPTPSVRISKSL